jgi:hypothetical protein
MLFTKVLFLSILMVANAQRGYKKVLLKDISTLTLYASKITTGRRSSPIPQLQCIGGDACVEGRDLVMQCQNVGWDGVDVNWKCQAELEGVKFGETTVVCEGFDYPEDPFVLAGSCGCECKHL